MADNTTTFLEQYLNFKVLGQFWRLVPPQAAEMVRAFILYVSDATFVAFGAMELA